MQHTTSTQAVPSWLVVRPPAVQNEIITLCLLYAYISLTDEPGPSVRTCLSIRPNHRGHNDESRSPTANLTENHQQSS